MPCSYSARRSGAIRAPGVLGWNRKALDIMSQRQSRVTFVPWRVEPSALPTTPAVRPVQRTHDDPQVTLSEGVAAANLDLHVQQGFLDVWGQQEQVHQLSDPRSAEAQRRGELGLVAGLAAREHLVGEGAVCGGGSDLIDHEALDGLGR